MARQIICQDPRHNKPCDYNNCAACLLDCDLPKFYDCGICGSMHPANWDGDCRDDSNRFALDELDAALGATGWVEVDMEEAIPATPKHGKGLFF